MRLSIAILLAAVAAAAHATDITVNLPIDKVTVYRGSAIVTRTGVVEFQAGEHRLIVRGLPEGVDPATLRLSAKSGGLRLGAIETERIFDSDLVGAAERAINRKLRDLTDQKGAIEITSFHASAFPIEIIDRVPVPRENDIRIEVLKGATPPTTRDLDGHADVFLWRLAGEPRKTETIRHYYSVRFPRTRELRQTEGT